MRDPLIGALIRQVVTEGKSEAAPSRANSTESVAIDDLPSPLTTITPQEAQQLAGPAQLLRGAATGRA